MKQLGIQLDNFDFNDYIETHTLRSEISHRGGGIEIDAADYLWQPGAKMTAYQNYLGGGMTGSVQSSCNIRDIEKTEIADRASKLAEALKYYFYCISNDIVADWDNWAATGSFAEQQRRAASAY